LKSLSDLKREVFGPVLHVIRYRRNDLNRLIDDINAFGYGLTFGLHTRLDETVAHVTNRMKVGNFYVNRNIIGAVVGVQPFGGRGLSGTGPKAGGPLYLGRLVRRAPAMAEHTSTKTDPAALDFIAWLDRKGLVSGASSARRYAARSSLGLEQELAGPIGERNLYAHHPRGRILLMPQTDIGLHCQVAAALATGNILVIDAASRLQSSLSELPGSVASRISWTDDWEKDGPFAGALVEGDEAQVRAANQKIADLPGPLVLMQSATTVELKDCPETYCLDWLLEEVSTSVNMSAIGGNASLMAIS
jgi:RHH-type transcriptional regulator, proline utilization regulon repressor / proline dehydrogenase / delta 1-pyrroline-5-carboxylate dehydrogenase